MSDWRAGWRLALGTLTILPSGPVEPSAPAARRMVALAPVAVLPLAAGAAAIGALGGILRPPAPVTGLLVVAWLAFMTRGMHLDAVADVADGTAAGWNPARAREVLKRGDIGPMGVVALVVVLGLQAASIGAIAAGPRGWLVIAALVAVSRWLLAPVCVDVPAMPGSSLGAAYARAVPVWEAALWSLGGLAAVTMTLVTAGSPWWLGPVVWLPAVGVAVGLRAHARRTFQGINGDILGAAIELGLTVGLVVLACL